jgi:1-deoxy-D-xylulose-5-phosphate synthase
MLEFAFKLGRPVAIRYPKGKAGDLGVRNQKIELGKPEVLIEGKDFVLIALGSMVAPALGAAAMLKKEGLSGAVINARFAKPLDSGVFTEIFSKQRHVFTIEEGISDSGFGSSVEDLFGRQAVKIGLPCSFVSHGQRELLLEKYGLTAPRIADKIRETVCPK